MAEILVPVLTGLPRAAAVDGDGSPERPAFDDVNQIRQRGAFSSFCLPDADIHDEIWPRREANGPRTPYSRAMALEERLALERRARLYGCSLALDLTLDFRSRHPSWKRARLEVLRDFLDSMPDSMVRVVESKRAVSTNLTIIGDWYAAESLSPSRSGYRETVFRWHAPTVYRQIQEFDQEFEQSRTKGWGGDGSRLLAIEKIGELLRALPESDPTPEADAGSA